MLCKDCEDFRCPPLILLKQPTKQLPAPLPASHSHNNSTISGDNTQSNVMTDEQHVQVDSNQPGCKTVPAKCASLATSLTFKSNSSYRVSK